MKGLKTVYICSECEYSSLKWLGKCPKCGAWNSFVEDANIDGEPGKFIIRQMIVVKAFNDAVN